MKVLSVGSRCEVCGKLFASQEAKQRHMGIHLRKSKKEGLIPHFIFNPKTGDNVFKGFKLETDFNM